MKNSISPYPDTVRIKNIHGGAQVFEGRRYIGEVHKVSNWGNDWLARPEDGRANLFFAQKTEAVRYLIATE